MKTIIEEYRGFEINFDTNKEMFYALSDDFDTDFYKKSYSAVKNYIDSFIKENSQFRPFKIISKPGLYNRDAEIEIIGIRKDGRFIYKDKDGNKKQLSVYCEDKYMIPHKDDDINLELLNKNRAQIKKLQGDEKLIINRFKNKCFSEKAIELKERLLK
jgi:hypothetical protein